MKTANITTKTLFIILLLLIAGISYAGVDKSGVKPQVISLPKGPGSIEGLGESFEPQLNSGTTTYAVKLKAPPGRTGFQPDLTLRYNGGSANTSFGLGWSLPIPYIQRQTDKGLPEYNDKDTFIESSGEELVPIGGGVYRHENEGAFIRYKQDSEGWTAYTKSGVLLKYGFSPDSQVRHGNKTFRWLLKEMTDTNGNTIQYKYTMMDQGPRQYCDRIIYNNHEIVFEYESRPDALPDYRPTFRLETAFRCKSVSMVTQGKLVRCYDFSYVQDFYISLLESVVQVGKDGVSTLPPATFTYTQFDPSKAEIITIEGSSQESEPPFLILAYEPDAAMNDMNGDGLPDLLIAGPGDHQVYFNMGIDSDGKHRWSKRTEMGSASPGEALGNDGASLADIDGDGRTDFIARRSPDTYFLWRNNGTGTWGPAETFADKSNLPFDFENPGVRLLDINNDKHIDVMYCNDGAGDTYSFFMNNKGAEFGNVLARQGLGSAMTFDQRPGMKLADMNGDRLQDIVLLQDGVCMYWPSSGVGEWDLTRRGDWKTEEIGTGTKMFNPPDSETDTEPGLYNDWPGLMLTDLNGDGLTDVIYAPEGAGRVVYWLNRNSTLFEGPFKKENVPVRLGNTTVQPADMNGNGTTDILWNYPEDNNIIREKVWQYLELCPDEKPYLLKTVTNGIGRTITFYYSTTTQEYIRDSQTEPWAGGVPNPVTVLSAFDVEDGRGTLYRTELSYHDGYYDSEEKEFRGFARAEKMETGDATVPGLVMAYEFDTGVEQDALKGRPLVLEARVSENLEGLSHVFYRENYEWKTRELAAGSDGDERKVTFPYQEARTRDIIEKGNGEPVQMKWEYEYDNYGNMTKQVEHGRTDGAWDDERVTTFAYAEALPEWILDKVAEQIIKDKNDNLVAHKRNYYDGNLTLGKVSMGNLTRIEDWVSDNKYVVSVRNEYDEYGNITAIYDPLYGQEPGHFRRFVYDGTFHTFPIEEHIETGSLTLSMFAAYDYGLGIMKSSTDFNGHTTSYDYDCFGRLTSITKPPDADAEHTVEYDYVLAHDLSSGKLINWVETRQRDGSAGDGFLHSRSFYDGMGRKIMTRSEGELPGQVVVTDTLQFNARQMPWKKYLPYFETGTLDFAEPTFNTGFTEHFYDALGREIRVNQPAGPDGIVYSAIAYEPFARTVRDEEQTKPGSPHYGCGMRYVEDGLLDKDGKGRLRQVYEIVRLDSKGETVAGPVEWLTSYTYDLLDNLTGYTDSQMNQKIIEYDGLGRKAFMNDPDRGHMYYTYDDAGNLIRTRDAKGQVIRYAYDGVNRLTGEYYGENKTEPDVEYFYDKESGPVEQGYLWLSAFIPADDIAGAILDGTGYNSAYDLNNDGMIDVADVVKAERQNLTLPKSLRRRGALTTENTKGFLSRVRDQSGEEYNSYDERGRVTWVVKRICTQQQTSQVSETCEVLKNFFTGMEYDSMDRVTKLTYPDSTYVTYDYNTRGLLESVPGVIEHYGYNPAGQNAELALACGTATNYDYDHRLRLKQLKTVRSRDNLVLQDLSYVYDGVSNITRIDDGRGNASLDAIGQEFGIGSDEARKFNATQSFTYDSLYRLTQASNSSVYGVINYRYDPIGNMIAKNASLVEPDPMMDLGEMTCGGDLGTYGRVGRAPGDAPGPHAVTGTAKGSMKFEYDDNGNMTSDNGMSLNWDFQDRLVSLKKGAKTADYVYDYTGIRKRKSVTDSGNGATDEVVYVDKLSEVRDGKLVKYVYAGNSRIARSDSQVSSFEFQVSDFYLHDHLGSTAFSLSDEGMVIEGLVNFPYGSPRMERRAEMVLGADYKFTGKERDLESGLQYFEARYLATHLSRFISIDPLYSEITSDYNSKNGFAEMKNLYSYTINNPVRYIDKNGLNITACDESFYVDEKMLIKKVNEQWEIYIAGTNFRDLAGPKNSIKNNLTSIQNKSNSYTDHLLKLIKGKVKKGEVIRLIAGHSQGGMQAQILTRKLKNRNKISKVITYGSPTIGKDVKGVEYERHAIFGDIVPLFNLSGKTVIGKFFGHVYSLSKQKWHFKSMKNLLFWEAHNNYNKYDEFKK
ncbi:MAG: hypothetical protein GY749_33775 [Desulfobacteraceae bacterium]|nr:hypothetical protein [Desulfobacteraceae bacterium]